MFIKTTTTFRKKQNFLTLLLPMLAILVSCAPMTTEYYRPDATTGKIVSSHCPPVKSFILFKTNGVIYGVRASKTMDNQIGVTITFEVPEGKVVKLNEQKVYSLSDSDTKIFAGTDLVGTVWVSAGRTARFTVTDLMVGKTEKKLFFKQITLYGNTEHAYFIFSSKLQVPKEKSFRIKLPSFSVNNLEIKPPIIKFTMDREQYIGPLNC